MGDVKPFRTVFVANRGEIAARVFRTARRMGYRTVAGHSTADRGALFTRLADMAVEIGPAAVKDSYLNIERVVAAAKRAGADAVHPGYGFLSENEDFAQACLDAGLVFIGPSPKATAAMGSKRNAKDIAAKAGVAGIPGYNGPDQSDERLTAEAERIGFALMVKASAGGGGRGMRLVASPDKLGQALRAARSEAMGAFGDDELILERAILEPRHVEIQIFGDSHGNVVHLGERDCSVQRRHQKVVEEAPSPAVSPELRARVGAAAVKIAKAIDYVGAGTMEFLLDKDGSFYFLEMNTRLQVEHPVTELITGLDLVEWQLRVAAGERLPKLQSEIFWSGAAIEVRLYAEDAYAGFLPRTGRVLAWHPSTEEGTRIDHGLLPGQEVTPFYDPMLAKVIGYGRDREEARRRCIRAIETSALLGVPSNRDFLALVLEHEAFGRGEATTAFIDRVLWPTRPKRPAPSAATRALAAALIYLGEGSAKAPLRAGHRIAFDLDWRGQAIAVGVTPAGEGFEVELPDARVVLEIVRRRRDRLRFRLDGIERVATFARDADGALWLDLDGRAERFGEASDAGARARAEGDGRVRTPIMGRVMRVAVAKGDAVAKGQLVATVEAMKMEHEIVAEAAGRIESVDCKPGDQVAARQVLAVIAKES